jgi:ABC-type transporter Mla subunit MlaD
MNEQALRFRIGVFVLAALLLLAVLITLFGSFPRLFVRAHEYVLRFADAPGVEPGTPVRRSGVRVGEVKSLTLDDETGEVRVAVVIEHRYTLRRNEQPTLVHGLLGGDTSIDFVPVRGGDDKVDRSPVPPGSELAGARVPTMNTLLAEAQEVLPTTQEALNDIRKAAQRLEKMAPLMEETAREYRDLAKASREMVPELRKTNDEVREMAKTTREAVPEIRKSATDIGGLARSANEALPELRRTNEEIGGLAKEARQALPDVRKSMNDIGALARDTREAVPELRKTNEQLQATLITWQKTGERAKLILDKNDEKITEAIDNLNDSLKRVGNVLSNDNQRNLSASLRNLRAGTENLPNISKSTEELIRESQKTMRKVNDSLGNVDELMGDLKRATKPFAERSPAVAKNLDESTARLNAVLADLQELFKAIDRGDGTLKKLITDPSLYNRLDEAACIVTRLLPKLEPILRDVNVFTDKIARHPESLGVRGAISPSGGLKESPTPLPLPEPIRP